MVKALAVMTSGGDAPGMNAAIRAVVRRGLDRGLDVYGVVSGYEGLVAGGNNIRPLHWHDVGGILSRGGTFLGTARSERFRTSEGRLTAVANLVRAGIEALVVIGGDGSLSGAHTLAVEWSEHLETLQERGGIIGPPIESDRPALKVVGLPGSIDNDLFGTDMCIGADTALNHIVRAVDNLSSTAASHQRTFVVETMGRHCGYLALMATLAGGASWVLLPEQEMEVRWHQKMVASIEKARETGRPHQMVIVAEGASHADGLPIRSDEVRRLLSERLGIDVRLTVLGHVQRGGAPTAFDRILATRLGVAAVDALIDQPEVEHRHMLGLVRNKVVATPLEEVVHKSREVGEQIEKGDYARALELRGSSFRKSLELVKTLTRITPRQEIAQDGVVAILTGGADAPGMNAAVSVAARCMLNQGIPVVGAKHACLGLIRGEFMALRWDELLGWENRPSSEIGAARLELDEDGLARIAENIEQFNIKGLIAIGGVGLYINVARMVNQRENFDALNIPTVLVPATIDSNLPCTEFCIGADTALNTIIDAVDKIRHTAGASRRAFIIEVMGRMCGYLALMAGLASGAEKAYLPESPITLDLLNRDVEFLKDSFEQGKSMVILLRNEQSSRHYTTDFIRRLLEEESQDQYEVRTAILGHIQRGGVPSAFDRILASRMGATAAFTLIEAMQAGDTEVKVLGIGSGGVDVSPLSQALQALDLGRGRPKQQWFMNLVEVAECLAKYTPCRK